MLKKSETKRAGILALSAALALAGAGCRGKHQAAIQNEEAADSGPRIASTLKVSDPSASAQLLHGFYGLESGTWRWTAGKFSVLLRSPLGGAQRGATLKFALNVPDVVLQKLHSVTVAASIGPTKLHSETYTAPGSFTFAADVPPEELTKETVTIDFTLDKSLQPGAIDSRELGVIALSVGLESK